MQEALPQHEKTPIDAETLAHKSLIASDYIERSKDDEEPYYIATSVELLTRNPRVLLDRVSIGGIGEESRNLYADYVQEGVDAGILDAETYSIEGAEDEFDALHRIDQGTMAIQEAMHQAAQDPELTTQHTDRYIQMARAGSRAFSAGIKHASERIDEGDIKYFNGNVEAVTKRHTR